MRTEQVQCIICKREFPRRLKGRTGKQSKQLQRGKNTITCSPKCSKIYRRVYDRARAIYERKYQAGKK